MSRIKNNQKYNYFFFIQLITFMTINHLFTPDIKKCLDDWITSRQARHIYIYIGCFNLSLLSTFDHFFPDYMQVYMVFFF